MGIWNRLFGSSETQRPEKPEPETESAEYTFTRYKTTVHYRNGDTETFESYGVRSEGGDHIEFNVPEVDLSVSQFSVLARATTETRRENWEVLSRRPEFEEIGEETYKVTWAVDYEWDDFYEKWDDKVTEASMERVDTDA